MNILYAPWRSEYTDDTHKNKDEMAPSDTCVFCTQFATNNDKEFGIIKRFENTIVMLNKYPYNAGHLLLLPLSHASSLSQLTKECRGELMELVSMSIDRVKLALGAGGVNIGINVGAAAGAGIPCHLHIHVLPRWAGDTNFMPTIGKTKVISFDLNKIYTTLFEEFAKVSL